MELVMKIALLSLLMMVGCANLERGDDGQPPIPPNWDPPGDVIEIPPDAGMDAPPEVPPDAPPECPPPSPECDCNDDCGYHQACQQGKCYDRCSCDDNCDHGESCRWGVCKPNH